MKLFKHEYFRQFWEFSRDQKPELLGNKLPLLKRKNSGFLTTISRQATVGMAKFSRAKKWELFRQKRLSGFWLFLNLPKSAFDHENRVPGTHFDRTWFGQFDLKVRPVWLPDLKVNV